MSDAKLTHQFNILSKTYVTNLEVVMESILYFSVCLEDKISFILFTHYLGIDSVV